MVSRVGHHAFDCNLYKFDGPHCADEPSGVQGGFGDEFVIENCFGREGDFREFPELELLYIRVQS